MPEATLPDYSFGNAFSSWTFDPVMAGLVGLLAVAYLAGVVAARGRWPLKRTALFLLFGLGGVVVCTMSSLAVYQHAVMWAPAVQFTLLIALVPVGIALGDPIGLARTALPARASEVLDRVLAGRVVRALTFPIVAAVLGVVVQIWVFFGPVLGWALRNSLAMDATYVGLLAIGSLLALPLLGVDLLPAWCTEPMKLLFAFFDGLIDALPGILVMTTTSVLAGGYYSNRTARWAGTTLQQEHLAGALVLALSEVVAIPLLLVLFFRWAAKETGGRRPDRFVSAEELRDVREPEVQRPWWESEGQGHRTDEFKPR